MNGQRFVLAIAALGIIGTGVFRAGDKDSEDPKYTIKQVMRLAHRKPDRTSPTLADKVITGKASADEQTKLLDYYPAMAANKPPKGDADAWKENNSAIVEAI